jgi:hypothetical protein
MTNDPYFRYRLHPDYKANRIADRRKPKPRQVEKRALPAPNPEIKFFFMLPPDLAFAVTPGPTGIVGVKVTAAGVEVLGHGRDWLFAQAAAFIRSIAKSYGPRAITGVLSCPPQPGTTVSGPMRPAINEAYTVEIVSGDPVVIISKVAMRPLVFAGRG